jgi:hypothetical protein
MIMEPFEVYRYYLALRLHFTTDAYDAIQQQGRVRASKQAFLKRNDLLAIRRVAETYSDKEVVNFLVSNFVTGDRWGGVFDTEAKERYINWKKRIESLTYTFQKEISTVTLFCEKKNIKFEDCLVATKDQHPYIIKMYLRGDVSIETLVILNKLVNFVPKLDVELAGDLIWPDVSRIITKYEPFLTIQKEKYYEHLRRATGSE